MLKLIEKSVCVLEAFTGERPEWSLAELSRHLGMPKGTVHHILASFKDVGWIMQDPQSRQYRLGFRIWEVGWSAIKRSGLGSIPRSLLVELSQKTGESVHLSIVESQSPEFVIYIDKVETERAVRAYTAMGGRAPSYCVASGKVILAYNPQMVENLLAQKLEPYSSTTIVDPALFKAEMDSISARGYSINHGEYSEDVNGLAAPIRNRRGEVFAAIGISGPAYRLSDDTLSQAAPSVIEVAAEITRLNQA